MLYRFLGQRIKKINCYSKENISWHTVVLVWQCVGMPSDNFFCFSYKNYIQKIQEDRKMRLVDAVFMRIKELMKERGLTMYRLAILSGVPRSTIATMQLSKIVTFATIYDVCAGLQITLKEFFDDPIFNEVTD